MLIPDLAVFNSCCLAHSNQNSWFASTHVTNPGV